MSSLTDILVLPLEGDLDVTSVPSVRAIIDKCIAAGCRRVILNMAETSYVDSLGMALLLSTARHLNELGGLLSLVNVQERVYRTLCICRLVDFVPVSSAGPKPPIPALAPGVHPIWQGTMNVDPSKLGDVRRRIEEVLERSTDLDANDIFDLTLAGGEALGNAIDHTCADGVLCSLEVYQDRVIVEVTDQGDGIELACSDEPPASETQQDLERGRGIKLMRMLADSVEIARKPNGTGTVVRLVKLYTPIDVRPQA